jgi:hypothetical protein
MYLKFQHKGIDLYFIQNAEFVETIPMDLTSFILWHLEKNRDLTDFFKRFNTFEYSDFIPDIVSRFIDYLFIHETAEAVLTISQGLNDFILNQENITNNEIRVQVINCFADLEFKQLLIATKRNNLIWNYLPNEIQNNEQILQFQSISFAEERKQLINQSGLGINLIYNIIYSFDRYVLNTSNLSWFPRTTNPDQIYLFDQNNNIIIEIDHKNSVIWILNSIWDNAINLFKQHPIINETNFNNLFRIYFMTDSNQLNISQRRLNSDRAFFNPLWLNAANYTINPTGEYANIHWGIVKQELINCI